MKRQDEKSRTPRVRNGFPPSALARRFFLAAIALPALLLSQAPPLPAQSAPPTSSADQSLYSRPFGPLVVNQESHVVVMEYEAWFGPNGVTFQTSVAKPFLQSKDMQDIGGGYDSADPAVIKQHVTWMEYMGVDAALIDLTNDVSCIFDSEWFVEQYLQNSGCPALRSDFQSIRDNTGKLYPAWSKLGTPLKLIPLLGGGEEDVLYKDQDGKTAFEKEIDYFGALMRQHPGLSVIYEGKPLMLIFVGAAQDPASADNPLWFQIRQFLKSHPEITDKYTFRIMAGYLDSQSDLWTNSNRPDGPVQIKSQYDFWSWVDRLNTSCTLALCPYYPSYNRTGSRVENFTASIATAGQTGWGCPDPQAPPYCPDDALRYGQFQSYATFDSFMRYARRLRPIFLILHQFNEFNSSDEGWDANSNDDIEPANQWGSRSLDVVKHQISRYRRELGSEPPQDPDDVQ